MSTVQSLGHDHFFLSSDHQRNERKVWLVIALTAAMMGVEIVGGALYGSMALVADGWHMSTHAGAMLITALAYRYARRHARDPRFTFGTGKLGDLAGFASAIVLALIALLIGWESLVRLANPVPISFGQAILVAVIGLAVNLACAWLLRDDHGHHHHGHSHGHGHGHDHGHAAQGHRHDHHDHTDDEAAHSHGHAAHASSHGHGHGAHAHPHPRSQEKVRDNNLRAAYLHVLADALTSVLAIAALLVGRSYGWLWADPLMGVVGALVIARWSWGLIRDTGNVLLDAVPQGDAVRSDIRQAIEPTGAQVTDLHVWQVGPSRYAAIVSLAARAPHDPAFYKARLAHVEPLAHLTVEVQPLMD